MLEASGAPREMWAEAMNTAVYALKRTPVTKDLSPFEIWFRVRPVVAHMRPFWTETFSHIHEVHRTKLDAKARKGRLVGYCLD